MGVTQTPYIYEFDKLGNERKDDLKLQVHIIFTFCNDADLASGLTFLM